MIGTEPRTHSHLNRRFIIVRLMGFSKRSFNLKFNLRACSHVAMARARTYRPNIDLQSAPCSEYERLSSKRVIEKQLPLPLNIYHCGKFQKNCLFLDYLLIKQLSMDGSSLLRRIRQLNERTDSKRRE